MSNYEQRAETVERWVRSCETQEQLNLCKEAVLIFVVVRPGEEVAQIDQVFIESNLAQAIEEMEKVVTNK